MTQKQIANRLRALIPQIDVSTHGDIAGGNRVYKDSVVSANKVRELADELDPPAPEPGALVVWMFGCDGTRWHYGIVNDERNAVHTRFGSVDLADIKWEKAQVLKPGQIAVEAIR